MNRRSFMKSTAITSAALSVGFSSYGRSEAMKRKFKICLRPGSIGVSLNQEGVLEAAIEYGYEAIEPFPKELANWDKGEIDAFKDKMAGKSISWGSAGLPVQFRQDETTFKEGLGNLEQAAEALQQVGASRMNTWIMPTHPTLSYVPNMKQHANRLGECAKILADHNVQLGLEYVGPKTLMAKDRYPFIHTLAECQELIENTGQANVGIQLDSFHWYCGEDTEAELLALNPKKIVTVDLNDARSDLSRDAQIDGTRELIGATGTINIATFLKALVAIGYEGPVRSEPFNKKLNEMEDIEAMKLNIKSIKQALKKSGIE